MPRFKFVLTVVVEADNSGEADQYFWDLACDGALNDCYTTTPTNEPVTETH